MPANASKQSAVGTLLVYRRDILAGEYDISGHCEIDSNDSNVTKFVTYAANPKPETYSIIDDAEPISYLPWVQVGQGSNYVRTIIINKDGVICRIVLFIPGRSFFEGTFVPILDGLIHLDVLMSSRGLSKYNGPICYKFFDGIYQGQYTSNGDDEDYVFTGTYVRPNGDRFTGFMISQGGKILAKGKYLSKSTLFVGTLMDWVFTDGETTISVPMSDGKTMKGTYTGTYVAGGLGTGSVVFSEWEKTYEGTFVGNVLSTGKCITAKSVYVGAFANWNYHGKGEIVCGSTKYNGIFKNNCFLEGVVDCDQYVTNGVFSPKGLYPSDGSLEFRTGELVGIKFKGNCSNNGDGHLEILYPNGSTYVGMCKNWLPNGAGTFTDCNNKRIGTFSDGTFVEGTYEGVGVTLRGNFVEGTLKGRYSSGTTLTMADNRATYVFPNYATFVEIVNKDISHLIWENSEIQHTGTITYAASRTIEVSIFDESFIMGEKSRLTLTGSLLSWKDASATGLLSDVKYRYKGITDEEGRPHGEGQFWLQTVQTSAQTSSQSDQFEPEWIAKGTFCRGLLMEGIYKTANRTITIFGNDTVLVSYPNGDTYRGPKNGKHGQYRFSNGLTYVDDCIDFRPSTILLSTVNDVMAVGTTSNETSSETAITGTIVKQ